MKSKILKADCIHIKLIVISFILMFSFCSPPIKDITGIWTIDQEATKKGVIASIKSNPQFDKGGQDLFITKFKQDWDKETAYNQAYVIYRDDHSIIHAYYESYYSDGTLRYVNNKDTWRMADDEIIITSKEGNETVYGKLDGNRIITSDNDIRYLGKVITYYYKRISHNTHLKIIEKRYNKSTKIINVD